MSKEEFLKIQTCVLKVNIHCDGCKHKVKKILQKIDGVYTTNIDSEQGKVTVSGNIDPATLIKKLTKNGKHAEIWGASKANNNNLNQMNNQFKNLQIDNGSKGGQNKGQNPKGGGNNQPKGGLQAQNPQFQQQLQQLQQLQQMKALQDMKIPPQFMKDLKGANNNKDQNQKSVKFNMPEDEELSGDDFDDDDFDDDDDDFDDEVDDIPVVNKMKPPVLGNGHGGAQMGNNMMNNIANSQHPQLMKGGGNNGGNGSGNGKKGGGGGNVPVQMNLGGGNQNQGGANGGKKGGNGNNNGGNQNQGGGKGGKNGGGQPNGGGGGQPNGGSGGGGGQNKNGGGSGGGGAVALNGNNSMGHNGARKGGGMNDGPHGMPNMMPMSAGGNVGPLGANMPMGQLGNLPMGQMNNLAAVQGLPASAMTGGGGGGAGYFPAPTPEHMTTNPYYQQQLATMMMNQQRANGNERFQPMMYARPPPAVNYMPPYPAYPYPYPYAPPHGERTDQYTMFSDENTSSCNVM